MKLKVVIFPAVSGQNALDTLVGRVTWIGPLREPRMCSVMVIFS